MKLTYVAASNYRPVQYQDEVSAKITWNKKTRQWEEGPNGKVATYKHIADFQDVVCEEMGEEISIFRMFV